MKGFVFACDWLQDPIVGDYPGHEPRPFVASRTRALWVPEAGILLQWPLPTGSIQVSRPSAFPPPADKARTSLLGEQNVPYQAVREARKYLERQEHNHAQAQVIQQAANRITEAERRAEGRLQAALTNAHVQM